MMTKTPKEAWGAFLEFMEERSSAAEYKNWLAPIQAREENDELILEVPNIFVQEYLLQNYRKELEAFLVAAPNGKLPIRFAIVENKKIEAAPIVIKPAAPVNAEQEAALKLNQAYTFEHFIEGSSNQFVKSAAIGIASRPGRSYNPLFIHGGVGLGKTHLLHAIGNQIRSQQKKLKVQCITTEEFINDLVSHLKSKSIEKMKRFYRSLDVLLVDDIQFLQSRLNFEEELCNTFESLLNQNKQIVITSDKPPGQLKLSERLVARMEWGLVAHISTPDLETRAAILLHKAEQKGLKLPHKIAFFIAERIFQNVRQLEGALNRLCAYSRMIGLDVTEEVVEKTLCELFQTPQHRRISVDSILKNVAAIFGVRVSDLCGKARSKDVAFPRQVAMYLAKELVNDSLMKLASAFGGKTHSTLLHAWKKIAQKMNKDEHLQKQIQMARRNLES